MPPDARPALLSYAAAGRRRRWPLVVLGSAAVLAAAGWLWGPDVARWQRLARVRHAALTEDVTMPDGRPAVDVVAGESPDDWFQASFDRPIPTPWAWYQAQAALLPVAAVKRGPVPLFVHGRTTPSGRPRLVVAGYNGGPYRDAVRLTLDVRLFDPGTVLRPAFRELTVGPVAGLPTSATVRGFPGAILRLATVGRGHAFTLGVGRPDPDDSAGFLFDYTVDGRPGVIVGRLDDGGGVTFRTADGSPLPIVIAPR